MMITIITLVPVLAFSSSGKNPNDAPTLIREVAAAYRNLNSYVIRAEESQYAPGERGNPVAQVIAYRDATHFSYRSESKGTAVILANGPTVRYFRKDLNEYLEEPLPTASGMQVFNKLNDRLIRRFQEIDQYAERASDLGTKRIKGVTYYHVEIKSKPNEEQWVDKLWIDPTTKLIHKVERTTHLGIATGLKLHPQWLTAEATIRYFHTNETIPDRYLDLKIPADARRTSKFSFRPGIYTDPPMASQPASIGSN
jgi:outer membrane lipoprotein-sorting protein